MAAAYAQESHNTDEWPVNATLEPGLDGPTIRQHLNEWVSRRRNGPQLKHYTEASDPLEVLAQTPPTPVPCAWCKSDD